MNMIPAAPIPKSDGPVTARQVAALCWRQHKGLISVVLITSRETGRWVIPKGWPIHGLSDAASAAREAWEEAGVRGQVQKLPLGGYGYDKVTSPVQSNRCNVAVFALEVENLKDRFPEAAERRRAWFTLREAAALVVEPDLSALLLDVEARPGQLTGAVSKRTA